MAWSFEKGQEWMDGVDLDQLAHVSRFYVEFAQPFVEMMSEHWHETLFAYVTAYPGYEGLTHEALDRLTKTRASRLRLLDGARSERAEALECTWETDPEWLDKNRDLIRALMAWSE